MKDYCNNREDETYVSVMATIYSIIEDGRLQHLDLVLRRNFSGYYLSPFPIDLTEN